MAALLKKREKVRMIKNNLKEVNTMISSKFNKAISFISIGRNFPYLRIISKLIRNIDRKQNS